MSTLERARKAIERITGNTNGFAVELTFIAPTNETADIAGTFRKIKMKINEFGVLVPSNTTNASVTIAESALTAQDYPTRKADGKCDFKGHKVTLESITYIIEQWMNDDTLGSVVCILGNYE